MVVDIPNVDTSKLPEGMDEEATELPCEPKKEPEGATNLGEGVSMKDLDGGFQISPDSASPSMQDNILTGSSSLPLVALGIYIQEWGLTRESLLMKHHVAYERGLPAFPPTTIEALDFLSNSHMSNSL